MADDKKSYRELLLGRQDAISSRQPAATPPAVTDEKSVDVQPSREPQKLPGDAPTPQTGGGYIDADDKRQWIDDWWKSQPRLGWFNRYGGVRKKLYDFIGDDEFPELRVLGSMRINGDPCPFIIVATNKRLLCLYAGPASKQSSEPRTITVPYEAIEKIRLTRRPSEDEPYMYTLWRLGGNGHEVEFRDPESLWRIVNHLEHVHGVSRERHIRTANFSAPGRSPRPSSSRAASGYSSTERERISRTSQPGERTQESRKNLH